MTRFVAFGVAFILVFGLGPPAGVLAAQNELEKVAFVHYRTAPALPDVAVAAAKGLGGCPDPATCRDHSWKGLRWGASPVSYELNASGSGVSAPSVDAAVRAAFTAWTRVTDGLATSASTGATSCTTAGVLANGKNQVCFRPISEYTNAIAVTYVWYWRSTKLLAEADVVFNTASGFTWSYTTLGTCAGYGDCNAAVSDDPSTYDIRDIGTHEFGHFLAFLGDLYSSRDAQLTMYGYGSPGELQKDSLGKGDCIGITDAYGGSCQ